MIQTAIRSMVSARRKFFMKSTSTLSRKKESNVFAPRRPK